MNLKVVLPHRLFSDSPNVRRLVVETPEGSFGILPRRRDGVVGLVPGILVYENADGSEVFLAVDEGILLKTGSDVSVMVRHAIRGGDLATLQNAVRKNDADMDAGALKVHRATSALEAGFLKRYGDVFHG